jgi:hypothetical protein
MKITETNFNKIFYLIIIPFLFFISIILKENNIIIITLLILLYHIYSNYKFKTWPFNNINNPDSINKCKKNPYWTEYLSIFGSIILIKSGLNKINSTNLIIKLFSYIIIIISIIFGISHFRQIFIPDNYYYKWILQYI